MAESSDLSSILARLAQYSQPQTSSASHIPSASLHVEPLSNQKQELVPQIRSSTPQTRATIDPATITTWQEGIRCVTKIAAQSRAFEAGIRKMIRDQRAQELKWYAERQDLKRLQATRSKSSAEATTILNALNPGNVVAADGISLEASNTAELAKLDRKIYDAQLGLEESMSIGFKSLGVPFFGTPESLLTTEASDVPVDHLPKYSQPVSLDQIQALRRRMIAHLEDLYSD